MKKKSIWQDEYTIRSYESGVDGRTSVSTLLNLMQESAFRHAAHLKLGVFDLHKQGRIWALSRLLMKVNRYPAVGDHISVQTWPRGAERLFAVRDFKISDSMGETAAAATSLWLIVDPASQRPVRPDSLLSDIPTNPEKRAVEKTPGLLLPPDNPVFLPSFRIQRSDTDMQNHVNSVAFIDWIENSLPRTMYDSHSISQLAINYLVELFDGDVVQIGVDSMSAAGSGSSHSSGTSHHLVVRRESDRKDVAYCAVQWQQKNDPGAEGDPEAGDVDINEATIAACEKIACVDYTPEERDQILQILRDTRKSLEKRRSVTLPNHIPSALSFRPMNEPGGGINARAVNGAGETNPGRGTKTVGPRTPNGGVEADRGAGRNAGADAANAAARASRYSVPETANADAAIIVYGETNCGDIPADEEDIAFAPVWQLSAWLRRRLISSTDLTEIYIRRIKRIDPILQSVITLLEDQAREQASAADKELDEGTCRGPLHGVPWGAKDLFATAGIPTTWGANPYKEQVPDDDAYVVRKLRESGAVLLAKLSLGALAYGDIWFGGMTKNPWMPDQGSSGSSAGSASATSAALVAFSLGTETMGSIVSPSLQCGTTGLRPTFGRVPRTGAMSLSWSFDKIGPLCRTVVDAAAVFSAINGFDRGDPDSREADFDFDPNEAAGRFRLAYDPEWFKETESQGLESLLGRIIDICAANNIELVEIKIPEYPYDTLMNLVTVDAAASFEELTLTDRDDELVWQASQAWPNLFRTARFFPAVEYVQVQRLRRIIMQMMSELFEMTDFFISPGSHGPMLLITNGTGSPSLSLRAGFREDGTPFGVNLWGRPYDDARLCRIGMVFETAFDVWRRRPSLGDSG